MSREEQRTIVHAATILRGTVGSTVHGLHHGGQDDRDEMAIFVEPPEFLLGLRLARSGRRWARFEHFVERTQREGVRSGPGDLDLVGYSLRKWLRLAVTGNPTVLLLLFSPPATLSVLTSAGEALRELAPAIVSRAAGPRFLGWRLDSARRNTTKSSRRSPKSSAGSSRRSRRVRFPPSRITLGWTRSPLPPIGTRGAGEPQRRALRRLVTTCYLASASRACTG